MTLAWRSGAVSSGWSTCSRFYDSILVFTHGCHYCYPVCPTLGGFAADTAVKNLLDSVEMGTSEFSLWFWEDPLEKPQPTQCSYWKTPETEELAGYSQGSQRVGPD